MEKSPPIQNRNLASDFKNLLNNLFKKESADLLWSQCMLGNLKIVVDKKLVKEDGETTFEKLDNDSESKKTTVKIKKSVADAVHVCWRMSILLHELLHALHYLCTEEDIFEDETHGDDWSELFLKATQRGGIKECAQKLVSPHPRCIYKRNCMWCPDKGENLTTNEVYTVPKVLKKSKFGGNCQFCFTEDRLPIHLRRSASCRKEYQGLLGSQYKNRAKILTYIDTRVIKREGKKNGPPICLFCPAPHDKLLKVHLKANPECENMYMDKYNCNSKDALSQTLTKVGNRLRKQKQRAKGKK